MERELLEKLKEAEPERKGEIISQLIELKLKSLYEGGEDGEADDD